MKADDRKAFEKFWREDSDWYTPNEQPTAEKLLADDAWCAGMAHRAAQQRAELDASQMRAELYKAAGELLAKETNELEDRLAYLDRLVEAVDVDDLERVIGGTPSGEARNYLAILNIIIADIKAKE